MPKPTRQQLTLARQSDRRQRQFERRYSKLMLSYLSGEYYRNAKRVGEGQSPIIDTERLQAILERIYRTVTIAEAKEFYAAIVEPLQPEKAIKKKDIIDNLVSFVTGFNEGGVVNIWRSLLNDFIQVRIATRLRSIENTTLENIVKIIETSREEGLGYQEVAKRIRQESRGSINVNRSRAIARTETVTAGNQGKFMAAASSDYLMEKKWLPVRDARTRQSHLAMFDNPWIPLENDFFKANKDGVLEEALYPCDSRLSASNTVMCRCTLMFQAMRDSEGGLIRK